MKCMSHCHQSTGPEDREIGNNDIHNIRKSEILIHLRMDKKVALLLSNKNGTDKKLGNALSQ